MCTFSCARTLMHMCLKFYSYLYFPQVFQAPVWESVPVWKSAPVWGWGWAAVSVPALQAADFLMKHPVLLSFLAKEESRILEILERLKSQDSLKAAEAERELKAELAVVREAKREMG